MDSQRGILDELPLTPPTGGLTQYAMATENIQDIFNRMQHTRKELKEIKATYRDALKNTRTYQEVVDELAKLKTKKQQIEHELKND